MFRTYSLVALMLIMAFCCIRIVGLENQKAKLKRDRTELNHIKYGLFNVDEWKRLLAEILTKKIREVEITEKERPKMKKRIEQILRTVLDEAWVVYREKSGMFMNLFLDMSSAYDKIQSGIPQYADRVIDFLNDPRNREDIKDRLIKAMNEMADKTIGKMDYTAYNAILCDYAAEDRPCALRTSTTR